MRSEKMADILAAVILLAMIFCIVAVPVIGLGIGLGYALKALIPGLDLGWAIVAGAVFAVGIVDMTARFLLAVRKTRQDAEEEESAGDEPWIRIPRSFLYPEPPTPKRRTRRRGPGSGAGPAG
jgi:hypothetical protein